MKLTKQEQQIHKWLVDFYENDGKRIDAAHQLDHIKRVLYWMHILQKKEGGNLRVLIPAVLLHDIGQAWDESENQLMHAMVSAQKAPDILKNLGYTDLEIEKICETIELHSSRYASHRKMTKEGKIIFDADKLDAVGVRVLIRTAKKQVGKSYQEIAEIILKFFERFQEKVGEKIFYTEAGQEIGLKQIKNTERIIREILEEEKEMEKFNANLN